MVQDNPQELSGERLKESASESVRKGDDIRARVHDLTLLTRNIRDVERTGVRLLDPTVATP